MMWHDHGGWAAGDWIAMTVMMVIVWGGLVALVVWLVRGGRHDQDARIADLEREVSALRDAAEREGQVHR